MAAAVTLVQRPPSTPKAAGTARPPRLPVLTRAETAECTCPDACERDHEQD